MQAHRNIEKPTAQLYYKKLLAETNIDANWNILKCKVRHLKGTLQKANAWSNSTGAKEEDDGNAATLKCKLLKICPHYEQLADIFSPLKKFEVVVTDTSTVFDRSIDATNLEEDSVLLNDELSTTSEAISFASRGYRKARTSCVDKLINMEKERLKFREKLLNLEIEKFEWEKEVEKQKLEMNRYKFDKELELKRLELEQNERIKKYEIEMKYKNK